MDLNARVLKEDMNDFKKRPFRFGFPEKVGLYDPAMEKDSCGVGFVANIKGKPSHEIMLDAYHLNSRMDHRGGCGFEANTGDGAGILMALPFSFFQNISLGEFDTELTPGSFAVGNIFLPQSESERAICKDTIAKIVREEGQTLVGWREVPVDAEDADVGPAALAAQPYIVQLFIRAAEAITQEEFERANYVIRKRFSHSLRENLSLSCLLYTSPSPRDGLLSRMPSSA